MFSLNALFSRKKSRSSDQKSAESEKAAFQGDMAEIELNNIFQFIDYAALSGELFVAGDSNSARYFFQNGALIFGSLGENPKRIGEMLIESAVITEEQLSQCVELQEKIKDQRRLGGIVVEEGYLDYEKLTEILHSQAKEAFFETLKWQSGSFFFYVNKQPAEKEILIHDRIDHLLLEGIIRLDDGMSAA